MSFSADWLALREPYDRRARNAAVLDAVATLFVGRPAVAVVDLACGTGSTVRALSPRLPASQDWRLVDNDLSLLARAADGATAGVRITATPIDLARDLELALDGPLDLVTMSALLDLVSGGWLERLAVEAAARRLPVYAALTYDGGSISDPVDHYDIEIVAAFNASASRQRLRAALGPAAPRRPRSTPSSVGYSTEHGVADWTLRHETATSRTRRLPVPHRAREMGLR